jgi:hypothetical protein
MIKMERTDVEGPGDEVENERYFDSTNLSVPRVSS